MFKNSNEFLREPNNALRKMLLLRIEMVLKWTHANSSCV